MEDQWSFALYPGQNRSTRNGTRSSDNLALCRFYVLTEPINIKVVVDPRLEWAEMGGNQVHDVAPFLHLAHRHQDGR